MDSVLPGKPDPMPIMIWLLMAVMSASLFYAAGTSREGPSIGAWPTARLMIMVVFSVQVLKVSFRAASATSATPTAPRPAHSQAQFLSKTV